MWATLLQLLRATLLQRCYSYSGLEPEEDVDVDEDDNEEDEEDVRLYVCLFVCVFACLSRSDKDFSRSVHQAT